MWDLMEAEGPAKLAHQFPLALSMNQGEPLEANPGAVISYLGWLPKSLLHVFNPLFL
jgi:hypothetical protein